MIYLLSRRYLRGRFSITFSPSNQLYPLQRSPFSSHGFISRNANQDPFAVSYLINICGFSPKEASLLASKCIRMKSPDVPNAVLAFLKSHDFSEFHIRKFVKNNPALLLCNPEKTLLPKFMFFYSKGASRLDVARAFSGSSSLVGTSLEKQIIPRYNFLHELLQSDDKFVKVARRCPRVLTYDVQLHAATNIDILKKVGVPMLNVSKLVFLYPCTIMLSSDRIKKIIQELKRRKFDAKKFKFVSALSVFGGLSKSKMVKKFDCLRKWGWSEEDLVVAFDKEPKYLTLSEDKINIAMDFLVNKMGQDPCAVVRVPKLLGMSMEKRIVPRGSVAQVLMSKGKLKKDFNLASLFFRTENSFLQRYVVPYEGEIPQLLKLYEDKLTVKENRRFSIYE